MFPYPSSVKLSKGFSETVMLEQYVLYYKIEVQMKVVLIGSFSRLLLD